MDATAGAALGGATDPEACLIQLRIDFTTGYGDSLRQQDSGEEQYDSNPHSPLIRTFVYLQFLIRNF